MIYLNGAEAVYIDSILDHIHYNTGDIVWFKWDGLQYKVVAIKTHDGLYWDEHTALGQKP